MLYHDTIAKYYDYFEDGVKNDTQFYLEHFKNFKGKILEIGAGTGRITIPLVKAGLDVSAMDLSAEMLKILVFKSQKEKLNIKVITEDMRDFNLDEKFDAIIITFRVFQHLYTVKDQMDALACIKKHLLSNHGNLIFDVYNPKLEYIANGNWKWQSPKNIILNQDKKPILQKKAILDYRNRYNLFTQIMDQEFRITQFSKEDIFPLKMRFFFRFEIEHLLVRSGYKILDLYGDFYKNEFGPDSPEMIWIAQPK